MTDTRPDYEFEHTLSNGQTITIMTDPCGVEFANGSLLTADMLTRRVIVLG